MRLLPAVALLIIAGHRVTAQNATGIAAVDSAAAARVSWAAAVRASRAADPAAARAAVERAAAAWPTQPTYVWALATVSAQAGDTNATRRALESYANLGLGRGLRDTVFDRYRSLAWFARADSAHAANREAIVRSRIAATIEDSTFWPEGMDVDPRTGTIYVSSVRLGEVRAISRDGRSRTVWPVAGKAAEGSALAVRVDPAGDRLWVTVTAMPNFRGYTAGDSLAALLAIDLNGNELGRWPFRRGNQVFGDVAVPRTGDVLFTDSGEPVLYRLIAKHSLRQYRHPLFRSLQGIAAPPDARVAYVADYSHGILRVTLDDGRVDRVAESPGMTTLGIDGLSWANGSLIAIQNGVNPARVVRFTLSADGLRIASASVLDRRPDADEPTIGALYNGEFFYVGNSQWNKHSNDGRPVANAVLGPTRIFALPYNDR
jgi:sugar lactone lactonase YvrE